MESAGTPQRGRRGRPRGRGPRRPGYAQNERARDQLLAPVRHEHYDGFSDEDRTYRRSRPRDHCLKRQVQLIAGGCVDQLVRNALNLADISGFDFDDIVHTAVGMLFMEEHLAELCDETSGYIAFNPGQPDVLVLVYILRDEIIGDMSVYEEILRENVRAITVEHLEDIAGSILYDAEFSRWLEAMRERSIAQYTDMDDSLIDQMSDDANSAHSGHDDNDEEEDSNTRLHGDSDADPFPPWPTF